MAEVGVFEVGKEGCVEQADPPPHFRGHKHGAPGDKCACCRLVEGRRVLEPDAVMRCRGRRQMQAPPRIPDGRRCVGIKDLRPHRADPGMCSGSLHEPAEHVRLDHRVVIEDQDVLCLPLECRPDAHVIAFGETEITLVAEQRDPGAGGHDAIGRAIRRIVINHDDVVVGECASPDRLDALDGVVRAAVTQKDDGDGCQRSPIRRACRQQILKGQELLEGPAGDRVQRTHLPAGYDSWSGAHDRESSVGQQLDHGPPGEKSKVGPVEEPEVVIAPSAPDKAHDRRIVADIRDAADEEPGRR